MNYFLSLFFIIYETDLLTMMLGRTLPSSCLPPEKVITAPLTDVESAVTGVYVASLKRGN